CENGRQQPGRQSDQYVGHAAGLFPPGAAPGRANRRSVGAIGLRQRGRERIASEWSDMKQFRVWSLVSRVTQLETPDPGLRTANEERSEPWILTFPPIRPKWWNSEKRWPPGWPSSSRATSTCAGRRRGRRARTPT